MYSRILHVALGLGLLCASLATPSAVLAQDTITERSSNTKFDRTVSFTYNNKAWQLDVTGASLRRKWFVKGYAIAHYMQNPIKGSQEEVIRDIFSSDKAREVYMKWLHKLPIALIREGFDESIHKNMKEADYIAIKPDIDKFLNAFKTDAEVGDVTQIRWLPGGYLEVVHGGKTTAGFVNAELAKTLWSIWLGPESVVDRSQMVNQLTGSAG